MKKLFSLFAVIFMAMSMWAAPGDEIKSVSDIVSGKSYYLKGIYTSSKVDYTVYFGPTESDESEVDVKVQSTPVSDILDAMPITFTQVSTGWTLTTPNGMYLRPHSSNGQSYFCVSEVVLTVSNGNTKEGTDKGILIGGYTVNNTEWKFQMNKTSNKIGGYSSAQYALTLIEADEAKTSTSLTFGTYDAEINIGESFTEPTLTADPTSILSSVTYSGDNDAVATVNATTGALTFTGVDGEITVTANYAGDDTYKASSAKYTLTVVDPAKNNVTFDLSANQYGWDATNVSETYFDGSTYTPAVEGDITLSVAGKVRMWGTTTSSLRLYSDDTYGRGSITLTAATGYMITSIKFEGSNLTFTCEVGTYTNPTWTGEAASVTLEKGSNTPQIKSITVTYKALGFKLTTADTDFYGLYLENEVTIPEGIEAYTGVLNADETELAITKIEGTVLPAQTPVIVKSSEAGEYTFVESDTEAAAIANNSLKGVSAETAVSALAVEGKTVLTLGAKDGVVGFRQPKGTSIKANRVYLLVNTPAEGAAPIRIVEATTAVENVEANDVVKFIENGTIYIRKNGQVYNVAGMLVK